MFFAERKAAVVEGLSENAAVKPITSVGIIGAGTMGGGIAMTFANAGIPVTLLELNQEALDRGLAMISKNYGITVSKGKMSQEAAGKRQALITGSTSYDSLADVDRKSV